MTFEEKYKSTIDLLRELIPEDAGKNKPLLPHVLRVGIFLHDSGYSDEIVNAGLLHDMIEWTDTSEILIQERYGKHVYDIVMANTKNREITDPVERRKDYVNRCAAIGIDALIVKAADTLDSFAYYTAQNNPNELERCKNVARLILEKTDEGIDPIFGKLRSIV